jgi:hypothetical protein
MMMDAITATIFDSGQGASDLSRSSYFIELHETLQQRP